MRASTLRLAFVLALCGAACESAPNAGAPAGPDGAAGSSSEGGSTPDRHDATTNQESGDGEAEANDLAPEAEPGPDDVAAEAGLDVTPDGGLDVAADAAADTSDAAADTSDAAADTSDAAADTSDAATAAADADADPLGSLVGKSAAGKIMCSGIFYTRCDPNQDPSLSTCKGFWNVDRSFDVAFQATRASAADTPVLTMTSCRDALIASETCGQSTESINFGRATFTRASSGAFEATMVLVAQQSVYPYSGRMSASVTAAGVDVGYRGDSGWVRAGTTIWERGFLGCSGILRLP